MADLLNATINTVMLDMDTGIYEQICRNKDGSYTAFLNARYNQETLEQAYLHALDHIRQNDWELGDVQIIESRAHKGGKL